LVKLSVIVGYAVGIINITNYETLQWMHKPREKNLFSVCRTDQSTPGWTKFCYQSAEWVRLSTDWLGLPVIDNAAPQMAPSECLW